MKTISSLSKINGLIARFRFEIEQYNGSGLYDINSHSEDILKRLFNLVYSCNLQNLNILNKTNFPAIDLGDKSIKISIQVTSDSSRDKVKKTIEKFLDNKLYNEYKRLIIFALRKKINQDYAFDTQGKFKFDNNNDIRDFNDLFKDLRSLDPDKIDEIRTFLSKVFEEKEGTETTEANEVETIIDFIEYLSKEKEMKEVLPPTVPDPEGKIFKRFSDYSDVLVDEIKKYIPMYEEAGKEAEKYFGLDGPRLTWIRTYLQRNSDKVLRESNNDPVIALDNLCSFYQNKLSVNGKTHDIGAIRYYLLHELIECNIFPSHTDN